MAIERNVLAHLAQRRHRELDHVQPVVEVLAEVAGLDQRRELLVRRADDAHVDRLLLRRADLAHLLLLDRAQQLDLHRQRQVGDFVEEQRAAVRGLEEAVAVAFGAGERALPVAEELALHQVLGDRAAVHGDERLLGARAAAVDHPRGELLAAARLAVDEHRRLALGEPLDQSRAPAASPATRRAAGRRDAGCGFSGTLSACLTSARNCSSATGFAR